MLRHDVLCDETLDCQGTAYVLCSVICHQGDRPDGGHYTCRLHYATSAGEWWHYNNSQRRAVRPGEVATTATMPHGPERSYNLFYERRV